MSASGPPPSADANLRACLTLLQALVAQGLQRLVLCPGSRSGPLAVAAGCLESRGLQLFTAIDERSAAFLALGLARHDGQAAAVVTTSGTAVAHLLPAVVEADTGAIPLLLLTADRPARLKGIGANQTVNQEDFLRASCRSFLQADAAGLGHATPVAVVDLARRAWWGAHGTPPGAVHLNLPLEEPLHGSGAVLRSLQEFAAAPSAISFVAATPASVADGLLQPASAPGAGSLGWTRPLGPQAGPAWAPWGGLDPDAPGVVVAGPWRLGQGDLAGQAEALLLWQRRTGWPVLADGLSGLRGWPGLEVVAAYDLILADPPRTLATPQVLRLGPLPASRRLQHWLAAGRAPQLLITDHDPRNLDACGTAAAHWSGGLVAWLEQLPDGALTEPPSTPALALAQHWLDLERRCQGWLDGALADPLPPREPALARQLSHALPAGLPLMLASSSPVRDWETFATPGTTPRPTYGFRGASGIDGTLSLACGLAIAAGELVLLSGDLALLHDANGWLWHRQLAQAAGQLTVVLIENGGGGIFEQLPIRPQSQSGAVDLDPAVETLLDFERLFAMPQAVDQVALAAVHGVPSRELDTLAQLEAGLAWARQHPLALLVVRTDRRQDADLRQRLRRDGAAVLAEGPPP